MTERIAKTKGKDCGRKIALPQYWIGEETHSEIDHKSLNGKYRGIHSPWSTPTEHDQWVFAAIQPVMVLEMDCRVAIEARVEAVRLHLHMHFEFLLP